MIMTKDKVRELNAMAVGRFGRGEPEALNGFYEVATVDSAASLNKAAQDPNLSFVVSGMVIPAHKLDAFCALLQDENGGLPGSVLLFKTSEEKTTSLRSMPTTLPASRASSLNAGPEDEAPIHIHDIEIIPGRHEVKVKGKQVVLTFSEFRILQTLATKPGWVFSREKIIHAVHGNNYSCTERAVDVQVTGLRKKLGTAGDTIETVRGVGYRFVE
jgi:hypothetical protein